MKKFNRGTLLIFSKFFSSIFFKFCTMILKAVDFFWRFFQTFYHVKKNVWYRTRFHGFEFLELVPLKNLNLLLMGKFFFKKKFFTKKYVSDFISRKKKFWLFKSDTKNGVFRYRFTTHVHLRKFFFSFKAKQLIF